MSSLYWKLMYRRSYTKRRNLWALPGRKPIIDVLRAYAGAVVTYVLIHRGHVFALLCSNQKIYKPQLRTE